MVVVPLALLLPFEREDFGPDDYERLLALDDSIETKGVSPEALQSHTTLSRVRAGDDPVPCAVCLETPVVDERVRTMRCGHGYHRRCIDRWFENHVTCPICKHEVG